jgi:hypothetical protein
MDWTEIRRRYPEQWLIIEAFDAHTELDQHRILDSISVVETCTTGNAAFERYRQLHQQFPDRELYYVHTNRKSLEIREVHWLGIWRSNAAGVQR